MANSSLESLLQPVNLPHAKVWNAAIVMAAAGESKLEMFARVKAWCHRLEMRHRLHSELFLQVWGMGGTEGGKAYTHNVQRWLPVRGLGIWPGRRPPQRMDERIAMDCAAAALAKEEPPLASHPVVHVSGGEVAAMEAAAAVFGSGMVLQMWFPEAARSEWAQQSQAVYAPTIRDPLFQRERFYAPLFDASLVQSSSDAELDTWTCGATAYLREDSEAKAVLLLCRHPFVFDPDEGV